MAAQGTIDDGGNRVSREISRREFLKVGGAGLAGLALLGSAGCGTGGRGGGQLNAIFLPATWGTIVQDTLAPQYEEETGVRVNVELIARDAIHDRLATLIAGRDSSYDIFNLDYNWIPEFSQNENLVPLDDVLTDGDREDFFPTALEVGSYQGTLFGVPQTIHPHLLWYRRDLFEDPDVQNQFQDATGNELNPPQTMDEWLAILQFFNKKSFGGDEVFGWAAQAARGFGNVHTWLSFLFSYGADALNDDFTESTLSTPEAQAATETWIEAMQYTPPGINDYTYAEVTTAAQQGRIATALQWSWGAWEVDVPENSQTVGQWEFVQVPAGSGGQSAPHLAEWVISISRYSQNVDQAKDFIAWLESKKNDVRQADLGGGDPVRRSSYSNPELTEQMLPDTDVARFRRYPEVLEAMETTRPRPFFAQEERWELVVSEQLSALQQGQKSVEEALEAADAEVNQMLQG
ncbi:MAG: ABC transporter substrate-binding protein [Rubrobacteraceae bacterium]